MPVGVTGPTDTPPEDMGEEWTEDDDMSEEIAMDTGPIPGPESSTPGSEAPPSDAEPQAGPSDLEGEKAADTDPEPLPEFDPQWRDELEGLMFLGKLEKRFHWVGHEFVIRTMTIDETLEVGLLTKQYQGTLGDAKSYQAALCAACIVSVDGRPLTVPLTSEPTDTMLVNKFQYVVKNWFPPVLDAVYEKYLELDATVIQVIQAMQASSGNSHGQTTSTPTS